MQQEMQSLADAMSRYEQERAAPQVPPLFGLSSDALADVLLPILEGKLRQSMQGVISDVDHNTRQLVMESRDIMTADVLPKVALTVRVAETIEGILCGHGFMTVPPR